MSKWKDQIGGRPLHPESLMMSYGYNPEWSEGAIKSPIFQTSTFVFRTAEEGRAFFELAQGKREPGPGESRGLIYSRLNNPDLEIAEDRLALWDGAEDCALFNSGMAAIATTLLAFLRPGDVVAVSHPLYGGTHHLIDWLLPLFGIRAVPFGCASSEEEIEARLAAAGGPLGFVLIETPANPTNDLIDIALCAKIAAHHSTPERRVPAGGGQHLPGAAVPAPPGARGRPGALLGHQVHRRPQRPHRRGRARAPPPWWSRSAPSAPCWAPRPTRGPGGC